jgi:lysophospholipid acyltransferase (LPLAT)-like uncharacterized protein
MKLRFLERLVVALVPLILRLLAWTWNFRVLNRRALDELIDRGRPLLVATWHQMIFPGVAFFKDRRAVIMVSRSKDGELIARVISRMGFRSVRGSSSKGGSEALHGLVEAIRDGGQGAVMVDGPRGPAHEPKLGILVAAQRTGAPLIPLGCRASRALYGRNWDRTMLPLPFSTVVLSFGEPLTVPADATPEAVDGLRERLKAALNQAEAQAERHLRG